MIAGVVGNLIADVIWVPLAWLVVREIRRLKSATRKDHARTHELVQSLHEQVASLTSAEDQAQP